LILRDPRAVCTASVYEQVSRRPTSDVPSAGEAVQLIEVGAHCRGAIFSDGSRLKTPALEDAIDRVSQAHEGFYFGRFDLRAPSLEAFRRGQFCVIELNGVSAEATHIYDPSVSILETYRTLFRQLRIAFEIGAANRRLGAEPLPFSALVRLVAGRRTAPDPVRRGWESAAPLVPGSAVAPAATRPGQ